MNHTSEMVGLLTASLAKSTWLKHGSALKSFKKCKVFSEKKFQWPLSKDCVRGFISWAVLNKKLRPSTVQSYVSSLLYMHKINDLDSKNCSDFVVKSLIRGAENLNFYKKFGKFQESHDPPPAKNSGSPDCGFRLVLRQQAGVVDSCSRGVFWFF